jgi:antitoxin component of MazEF toxin-antitoxin module
LPSLGLNCRNLAAVQVHVLQPNAHQFRVPQAGEGQQLNHDHVLGVAGLPEDLGERYQALIGEKTWKDRAVLLSSYEMLAFGRTSDEQASRGYQSTIQVIQRGGENRQYYLIRPAPLAQALEIETGEVVEWVVEDKHTLILKRAPRRPPATPARRRQHGE